MAMYYLTDPYHPQLQQHLVEAVSQQQAKHDAGKQVLHVYALIDGALDDDWGNKLWRASVQKPREVQAVYQGTPLEEAEEAGLFIGVVGRKDIDALLSRARARPMLSFIQSALDLHALRDHLAQFSRGKTPDHYWYVLRWGAPTRVPDLLQALSVSARAAFLDGFAAWHLIARGGDIQTLQGTMKQAHVDQASAGLLRHGVQLTDAAVSKLVDAAEADLILSGALTQSPDDVRGRSAVALHRMAMQLLQEMDALRVSAPRLRSELVLNALCCNTLEEAHALIKAHTP